MKSNFLKYLNIFLFSISVPLTVVYADNAKDEKKEQEEVSKNKKFAKGISAKDANLVQKGQGRNYCPVCGMHISTNYKTSHAVMLEESSKGEHENHQYCSIHCLYDDLNYGALKDKREMALASLFTVDANSSKFIKVSDAYYVIGSSVAGTMTVNSKYAFSSEKEAKEFAEKYNGSVVSGKDILDIENDDFLNDKNLIVKNRERNSETGKNILDKNCDSKIIDEILKDSNATKNMSKFKAEIKAKKSCKNIDEKGLQALSIYLWDIVLDKNKRFTLED